MKTPFLPIVIVCLALFAGGCTTAEKTRKSNAAAQTWLDTNAKRPAATNIEGVYYSPEWGIIALNQRDGKITGGTPEFRLKGQVSGKTAFLLVCDGDWVEHTMILKRKSAEILDGSASSHELYSGKDLRPVHLDRIVD
jgi:hypothetical protein